MLILRRIIISDHHVDILVRNQTEVTEELLSKTSGSSRWYWFAAVILAALTIVGLIGFIMRLGNGLDDYAHWGYLAAVFAFILTTAMSAPLVAIAPRIAKAHWNRPVSRIAELWGVAGLILMIIMIPLLLSLPTGEGRNTIWFVGKIREGWPPGAPHAWLALAIIFLFINGLGLLWVSAIPDLAAARDRNRSAACQWFYRLASIQWRGTPKQWRVLRTAISVLGGLYFMFLIFAHTVVSFDFAQSLVPGMRDSIFPTWHALSGIQCALATVLVTAFVVRLLGGLKDYIGINQFWSMGKLLLASSLLWAYFWWSGFIVLWYGKMPTEELIMQLMWFGPYRTLFLTTFALCFLVPLLALIWNPVRKSILGPTLVAVGILVGTFVDRIRIYVGSYSAGDPTAHSLSSVPEAVFPGTADIMMILGAIGAVILLYLLTLKIIPVINIWETKEGLILQHVGALKKIPLKVLGKPE